MREGDRRGRSAREIEGDQGGRGKIFARLHRGDEDECAIDADAEDEEEDEGAEQIDAEAEIVHPAERRDAREGGDERALHHDVRARHLALAAAHLREGGGGARVTQETGIAVGHSRAFRG